jgi:putative lipoic acid-binding regulatory protein
MFDPTHRPDITYPTPWSFKVICTDEDAVRSAVREVLETCLDPGTGKRAWELGVSRTSSGGSYISLNLSLTVMSEDERNALFAGLSGRPEIRMVI